MTIFINGLDIHKIMESGQVFSIKEMSGVNAGWYMVISAHHYCYVRQSGDQLLLIGTNGDAEYWYEYFNTDLLPFLETLENDPNPFIRKCYEYSKGITILKQDLWQTLVSFIVSQRKNIPSIITSLDKFTQKFGAKVNSLNGPVGVFPEFNRLRAVKVEDLQDMGLGYRDKYIVDAVRWFKDTDINSFMKLSHKEQLEQLKTICGVGDKVANCISLFSLGNYEAFPVDVWIQKVLDLGLITQEDINRWGDKAGVVQQVIFYYVLHHKKEIKPDYVEEE